MGPGANSMAKSGKAMTEYPKSTPQCKPLHSQSRRESGMLTRYLLSENSPFPAGGECRMPHPVCRLLSILTHYGAFVLLQLIEAHANEGEQPPVWTGSWYDQDGAEPDWLAYWMRTTGLGESAGWKAFAELKRHQLVEVQGAGRHARFKPRHLQYPDCQARKPRGGWTRKDGATIPPIRASAGGAS